MYHWKPTTAQKFWACDCRLPVAATVGQTKWSWQSSALSVKWINQSSSDPNAGCYETRATMGQELHRNLSWN